MNAVTQHQGNSNALVPGNMKDAMDLARMMSRSRMMPQHLQGSEGDCLMVIEQAMRWNMSPFAVALCHSNIKGKSFYEGKIIAAAVTSTGANTRRVRLCFYGRSKKAGNA